MEITTSHRATEEQAICGRIHCFFCGNCEDFGSIEWWAADLPEYGTRQFCSWQCRDNALESPLDLEV